jgi:hypothetical protein
MFSPRPVFAALFTEPRLHLRFETATARSLLWIFWVATRRESDGFYSAAVFYPYHYLWNGYLGHLTIHDFGREWWLPSHSTKESERIESMARIVFVRWNGVPI